MSDWPYTRGSDDTQLQPHGWTVEVVWNLFLRDNDLCAHEPAQQASVMMA